MHFLGGVRKWIVAIVVLLTILSNLAFVSIEASAAEGVLTEEQEEFVAKFYEICIHEAAAYELAWQTPMAQAIVESRSGTSGLSVKYHNFHGITSSKGGYKHFASDEDGWHGYFENLEVTAVYGRNGIFETGDDPYKMLDVLVESGYAEDESYKQIIGTYIKLVDDWCKTNKIAPADKNFEGATKPEKVTDQKIKYAQPKEGDKGTGEIYHAMALTPTTDNEEKRDDKTNDPKQREASGNICRSFLCQKSLCYNIKHGNRHNYFRCLKFIIASCTFYQKQIQAIS